MRRCPLKKRPPPQMPDADQLSIIAFVLLGIGIVLAITKAPNADKVVFVALLMFLSLVMNMKTRV